ncbi:MAG: class I SAM-dependent methyltransferase [Synechococcus sp.]
MNIPIWQQIFKKLENSPNLHFLEIGSWEGRSTCWLIDNILTHESAEITCIDTFEGSIEHQNPESPLCQNEQNLKSVESRFDFNITTTGSRNKVNRIVGSSQEVLRTLPLNTYDFLYIDGSHVAPDVLEDAILGWRLVKVNGLIIFDDYHWPQFKDNPTLHPKLAIDAFLTVFKDKTKIIHKGYQVVIEKIAS